MACASLPVASGLSIPPTPAPKAGEPPEGGSPRETVVLFKLCADQNLMRPPPMTTLKSLKSSFLPEALNCR